MEELQAFWDWVKNLNPSSSGGKGGQRSNKESTQGIEIWGEGSYDAAYSGVPMQHEKAALIPVWKAKEVSTENKDVNHSRNKEEKTFKTKPKQNKNICKQSVQVFLMGGEREKQPLLRSLHTTKF